MPHFIRIASLAMALAATVQGHMRMSSPPPFRAPENQFATQKDFDMTSPLKPDGSNYPCKGYLSDLGTAAGASVATYQPGGEGKVTITGGAAHGGGSCQLSLSYDKGQSFTVIKSFIGECPPSGDSDWAFTVPDDAPTGAAVLAWTWSNKLGNPELYMNCASVTIGSAAAKPKPKRVRNVVPRAAVAFSARPAPFISNIGNGCKTENIVIDYPNPGPDVQRQGSGAQAPPCDGGAGAGSGGGGSGGGSGGSASSAAPAASSQPAATSAPTAPATAPAPAKSSSATSVPGGVFITKTSDVAAEPTATGGSTDNGSSASPTTQAPEPATSTKSPSSSPTSSPVDVSGQLTGQCSEEGAWNCIDGTGFQRCASGSWSAIMAVAPGTTCAAGKSNTLSISRKVRRGGLRRLNDST